MSASVRWFRGLFKNLSKDIALDLGTANTLAYVRGRGIVLQEPSVVTIHRESGRVLAVGDEAKQMIGKTPGTIEAIRPLRDGVIADFEVTEAMISYIIRKVHRRQRFVHPLLVVGIPCGCTEVERRAVIDAAYRAGARYAATLDEPMGAAMGAGLPITDPVGNVVVDIGAGTTEVAVVSLGGICTHQALRVAGDEMDEALVQYVRREKSLSIGERTAEEIKIGVGAASPLPRELLMEAKGKDVVTGLPRVVEISSSEVREAIAEPLAAILDLITSTLEEAPAELAADVVRRGIWMVGGGALLRGIDQLLHQATQVPVYIAKNPMQCVALGTGQYLEQLVSGTLDGRFRP